MTISSLAARDSATSGKTCRTSPSIRPAPLLAGLLLALGLIAAPGAALAGPLTPPSGAVAPSGKTLTEVEPRTPINAANTPGDVDSLFKITQPGSYYLTGNLLGVSGKHGIEIAVGNVSIDLQGFEVRGVPGSLNGISVDVSVSGLAVRDGTVTSWGGYGVTLTPALNSTGEQHAVERVNAVGNAQAGIAVGDGAIVRHCRVRDNTGNHGIRCRGQAVVEHCVAIDNAGEGISAGAGSVVSHCTVSGSSTTGVSVGDGSSVDTCVASDNGQGFSLGFFGVATGCTAKENSSGGFRADGSCQIVSCVASTNDTFGFQMGSNSTITGCVASGNLQGGIFANLGCLISRNSCYNNGVLSGSAGIRVASTGNRIEGNQCRFNGVGYLVQAGENIIYGNTAASNTTNWSVVAGNSCQVVVATRGLGAISGDSGGVSLGSTNPFVNFTY